MLRRTPSEQFALVADLSPIYGLPTTSGLAGNDSELASLVEQLDKASSNFGLEISAEKTKIMTNIKESSKKEIKVNGQILERVTKFKYLGSIMSDEGPKPEILSRIAQTTAALTKLKPI
ncbi:endonuclease-reverse transcriptase [Elysia marginata]|uniref:Endonuclease-reverse transcriptase n=1 Tax=Elysia marginata TaxID=1093978 RepID=A0AAV4GDT7_9GAST|nr:endonuclease-reverse transcriptase [Elysia marginata]